VVHMRSLIIIVGVLWSKSLDSDCTSYDVAGHMMGTLQHNRVPNHLRANQYYSAFDMIDVEGHATDGIREREQRQGISVTDTSTTSCMV